MSKADERLLAAFQSDLPPARDPAFVAEVMGRLERRGLMLDVATYAGLALAGAAVLWGVLPQLDPALGGWAPTLVPAAAVLTIGLSFLLLDRVSVGSENPA